MRNEWIGGAEARKLGGQRICKGGIGFDDVAYRRTDAHVGHAITGHRDLGEPRRTQRRADFAALKINQLHAERRGDDPPPTGRTRAAADDRQ